MWLKKVASVLLKGVELFTGFTPLLTGAVNPSAAAKINEISDDLTKVAGVVTTVEAIGAAVSSPLSGPEKLKAASPLVAQVVLQSDFMIGKKIKDAAKFQQGVSSVASGMADILSSLED